MSFLHVAFPGSPFEVLTYRWLQDCMPRLGMRVVVPFRRQRKVALVVGHLAQADVAQTREVLAQLDDEPILASGLIKTLLWGARYYVTPMGEVLRAALPQRMWEERQLSELEKIVVRSHGSGQGLPGEPLAGLTPAQRQAVAAVERFDLFKTTLLLGVTGSGKTHVYHGLIKRALAWGEEPSGQALLLVPEIGLTAQLLGRLQHAFGERLAVYHSELTTNQRLQEWLKIRSGQATLVVGTRSALFAPFRNLRLMIVDEEHDGSYKQEDGFHYHGRDLAIVRARLENCPIILGSATPAAESFNNALTGRYQLLQLTERPGARELPQVMLADLRQEYARRYTQGMISELLCAAIEKTLAQKKSALIFLNRRGYATSTVCAACGGVVTCRHCSVAMTYHRAAHLLMCHYCGMKSPMQEHCSVCHTGTLVEMGMGTEKVVQGLERLFPQARIARLDRDTTRRKGTFRATLEKLSRGEIDILVGTQMIVKGHDFPQVTLVGVVLADSLLHFPDFRAAEKTFQLLAQVSGRAGRGYDPGRVVIQTFSPGHYLMRYLAGPDYEGFMREELSRRRRLSYPPWARLVSMMFMARHETQAEKAALEAAAYLQRHARFEILGPAPAPLARLKDMYRWHILLKSKNSQGVSAVVGQMRRTLAARKEFAKVRVVVDVDPISML